LIYRKNFSRRLSAWILPGQGGWSQEVLAEEMFLAFFRSFLHPEMVVGHAISGISLSKTFISACFWTFIGSKESSCCSISMGRRLVRCRGAKNPLGRR